MRDLKQYQIYNEYLPVNVFNKLKDLVYKAKDDANNTLAGNIQQEYNLYAERDPEIRDYILHMGRNSLFQNYHNYLTALFAERACSSVLAKTWVNFQKKHEFNPLHTHDGVFSFVIFVKIPYDCEKYKKKFSKMKPNDMKAGMLSFQHIDPWTNRIESIDVSLNPKYEGGIYFFKSKHLHQVYPFYDTNEYRITVSGNLHLL
jgi:hypothetical protein|tara:strand:- start:858 stop:1463 length:606 start_codon:yes stop_codon:yes gene_type:complete